VRRIFDMTARVWKRK